MTAPDRGHAIREAFELFVCLLEADTRQHRVAAMALTRPTDDDTLESVRQGRLQHAAATFAARRQALEDMRTAWTMLHAAVVSADAAALLAGADADGAAMGSQELATAATASLMSRLRSSHRG